MRNPSRAHRTSRSEKGLIDSTLPAIIVMVITLTALAGWSIIHFIIPLFQDNRIPSVSPALPQDARAAIAGVSAFYTIDYTKSANQWAEQVCTTTTDEGCVFAKGYYAAAVHATAEKYTVHTSCTVLPVALVDNDETHMLRIWKMLVTLSNPWPAIQQAQTIYVAVAYDKKRQEWRMQHVLFDQEAKKYNTTPTP